jgi:hypothetical protein
VIVAGPNLGQTIVRVAEPGKPEISVALAKRLANALRSPLIAPSGLYYDGDLIRNPSGETDGRWRLYLPDEPAPPG